MFLLQYRSEEIKMKLIVITRHTVIRVIPETQQQLEFLHNWQSTSLIDFWSLPAKSKPFADILVSPESYVFYQMRCALLNKYKTRFF